MTETQAGTASNKPEEVSLRDVLKPANLIVALIASVLLILLGWYIFVLQPALSQKDSIEMRPVNSREPFSYMPFSEELKIKSGVETRITEEDVARSNAAFDNKDQAVADQNGSERSNTVKSARSNHHAKRDARAVVREDESSSKMEKFKSFFKPTDKPSCTQAQIALNQCPSN